MGLTTNHAKYALDASNNVTGLVGPGGGVWHRSEAVDLRDWNGLDLSGNNDNASLLQAAIDATAVAMNAYLGYLTVYRLILPVGRIAFSTGLVMKQSTWLEGSQAVAEGTELRWTGANGADALYCTASTSYLNLHNLRLKDFRTGATGGRGISIKRSVNGAAFNKLQVMNFPLEQIYYGADTAQSSDCLSMTDIWVQSSVATAKGILLERLDNNVILNNIKSDMSTTPANDGYVIRVINQDNDNATIDISNVKHEANNRCPTISLPATTRGNISLRSIGQRNPIGGAAGAGDIIQFGALAGGSAFAVDGTAAGFATGPGSEIGGRVIMQNITGKNHSDWTGATGAATIRGLGSTSAVYGPVVQAMLGTQGRVVRDIAGSGIPQAAAYGNVGDTYRSLDATSAKCALWTKQSGNGTNTGWKPTSGPETQSVSAGANPDINLGNRIIFSALAANTSVVGPTNVPISGTEIIYEFTQNGTGGYTLTYGSLHKGAWPTAAGTAGQKQTIRGVSDGTNIVFSGASGWY